MTRPFTIVCMLLAGGAGLYLYQAKHQAQMLDREIARTVRQADAARERAGVLSAEYALLNEPQRLGDLADQHLPSLKKTAPTQFTAWPEFEKRLPPVGAPAAEAAPLEPDAPTAKLPEPQPAPPPEPKPATDQPSGTRAPEVATATPAIAAAPAPRPAQPAAGARPAPVNAQPVNAQPVNAQPVNAQSAHAQPAHARLAHAQLASVTSSTARLTPVSLTASLQTQSAPAHAPAPHPPLQASIPAARAAAPPPRPVPSYAVPSYASPGTSTGNGAGTGTSDTVARIARAAPAYSTVPAVSSSALGMARTGMASSPVTPASAPAIWQPPQ